MKAQTLKFSLFSIFTLLLVLSFASALSFDSSSYSTNNKSITFNVNVNSGENVSLSNSNTAHFSFTPSTVTSPLTPVGLSLKDDLSTLSFGQQYIANLSAVASNSTTGASISSTSILLTFTKGLCTYGPAGKNITISNVDIKNERSSSDDTSWQPLDNIRIKVDVDNIGPTKVPGVTVVMALISNNDGTDKVKKLTFTSADEQKVKLGSITDGDTQTAEFDFKVPADFKTTDSYQLVIKAYATGGTGATESDICTETSPSAYTISLDTESKSGKLIAFDNTQLSPTEATCSDSVSLNFDVVNVGDADQDKVRVHLVNQDLGIDLSQEITDTMSTGDSKSLSFSFKVPAGLTDKVYSLALTADYGYKLGTYGKKSDESTIVPLKVFGCNVQQNQQPLVISTTLASDVVAGKDITINAKISNTGTSSQTFVLSATGFSTFASNANVVPETMVLNAGETKDVSVVISLNDNASGDKTFRITAQNANVLVSKDVSLSVPATGFSLGNNWLIWVIGAVNLLLIIVIILVAVRVSRR